MSRILINNRITQPYKKGKHDGIDFGREKVNGEPVFAHSSGKVVSCVSGKKNDTKTTGTATYGNYVKIYHGHDYYTLYAHLNTVSVKKGQTVKQGDKIGTMGNSGNSYGTHLHWEVRTGENGQTRINPTPYINADLPLPKPKAVISYQTHDTKSKKWLVAVKTGSKLYSGNGNPIDAVAISDCEYTVHQYGLLGGKWLPKVSKYVITDAKNGYAGNIGKAIDGIAIKPKNGEKIKYRVQTSKGWLPWVTGCNTKDKSNGYAGNIGQKIIGLQIEVV